MKRFFAALALVFIGILTVAASSATVEAAPKGAGDVFQFVWTGLKDNRERLHQGVFRVKGRKVDDDPQWGRLDGEMSIFCAFDYEKGLLRFDREDPERIAKPNWDKKGDPKESWTLQSIGGKWAQTEKQCMAWSKGGNSVIISRAHEKPSPQIKPFDVRTLGLVRWGNLEKCSPWKEVRAFYPSPPNEIVEERKGFYRIRWDEEPAHIRTTVWVDESQGFSPVRMHVQQGRRAKTGMEWPAPEIVSEVEWSRISEVWVPRSFRIEDREGAPRIMSYQMDFEWESVNAPLAEKFFTVDGMDLPDGTKVIDNTLGKAILKRTIGEGKQSPHPAPGFVRRFGVYFFLFGGFLVTAFTYWRYRSRPKSAPS